MRATRFTSLRVFVLLFVFLLLVLSFSFAIGLDNLPQTAILHAEENQPDAPGGISGVIRNANGEVLAGISVILYQHSVYDNYWYPLSQMTTDSQGRYRFALLGAGTYRLGMQDPQQLYSPLYYLDASDIFSADDLVINGEQRTDFDFTLTPGGEITGVVRAFDHTPLINGYVTLYQKVDGYFWYDGSPIDWVQIRQQEVTTSGEFHFLGLATDSYLLCASINTVIGSWSECYDNAAVMNDGTPIMLQAGDILTNVTMVLGDGADLSKIGGRITAESGEPLVNIDVYVIDVNYYPYIYYPPATVAPAVTATPAPVAGATTHAVQPQLTPTVTPANFPIIPYNYVARTDQDGRYDIKNMNAGDYHLLFFDGAGHYRYEYYDNVTFRRNATALALEAQQVVTDVNATLTVGAHLTGTVTLLGQPASMASISLLKYEGTDWLFTAYALTDPFTGGYDMGGLPAGRYRVQASAMVFYPPYSSYYFSSFYGGDSWETATEIKLEAGTTKANLDINLDNGPRFDGAIQGRITANGAPLANAKVGLYADCCYRFPPGESQTYALTDEEGRFAINGLTSGRFKVRVEDTKGERAMLFYPNQPYYTYENHVEIIDSQTITGIDIDLPPGAIVQGRLYDQDGAGLDHIPVMAITMTQESGLFIFQKAETAADGSYRLQSLYPGTYYICAGSEQALSYDFNFLECYGELNGNMGNPFGTLIRATAGRPRGNINILWGAERTQFLPLIAR